MEEKITNVITDGQDLADKAAELKTKGVTDVTVTVDTFNHTRYEKVTKGKHLQPVIDGINAATKEGLKIRLNVSIKEGFNEDEVLDFLQLTFQHKYDVVFMPTISYDLLKSKMPALRKIEGDFDGIEFYKYPSAIGRIGFLLN
ncbi:MAG: radical SAM protein [Bacillota bacterium]|nr:radical SAM protein [Bacillota bacterium]